MEDVEPLLGQDPPHPPDRARREDDVRQRAVRRHDDGATDRDHVSGQVSMPAGSRVEQVGEVPGWVVPHHQLHVVASAAQRGRLVLGVLDDSAPVRPGEGDDDPDLHARTTSNAAASRSAPSATVSSVTASDSRAQPPPLGPKPSPGATATRCSASSPAAVTPSGSRIHTKNVPSQTGGPGSAAERTSRRRSYAATRSATESCGPSSAATVAACNGSKMPTRQWSFRTLTRSTTSALPTTNPIRQPAIPYVFDIDHISTPTSFAPGTDRKLRGSRPSNTRSM